MTDANPAILNRNRNFQVENILRQAHFPLFFGNAHP
jgi:hypothetical protein